ncbi:MAG: sodium/proline symporter [Lachnospiraceae bacterium]|nr:sodium/proline symporter [Lachnospiraceae bacterium]
MSKVLADSIIMITLIAYLCLVIVVGIRIGQKTKKSSEGFYLGGRGIGPLVTAMSAEASDMSSYLLMGIPGLAYLSGLADASWTAIGLALGTYLNFLLVAKRLRVYSEKIDALTIPDFISKRYHEKDPIILTIAALIILIFFIPYVASGFSAIGKLLNSLLGWNYYIAVVIGAIVIVSYSSLGGFGAVATMDLIQSIIMTFAIIVIITFSVDKVGGINQVMQNAKSLPGFFDLFKTYDVNTNQAGNYGFISIVSTMAWGLGYFGMPHILVRFMAIRDENELKISRRIASIWVVISMFAAIFIGIIGLSVSKVGLIPRLTGNATETVTVSLASLMSKTNVFFAIVAGIIIAGIFAATMSTADSQLIAAASAVSRNLIYRNVKNVDEKKELVISRLSIVVLAIISLILAFNPDSNIFKVVSFAWAGFGATFGPVVLLALFWKRSNRYGALSGLIVGGITIFIWKFLIRPNIAILNIYELLPAFILALIVNVVVSLCTKEPEKEIIKEFETVNKSV